MFLYFTCVILYFLWHCILCCTSFVCGCCRFHLVFMYCYIFLALFWFYKIVAWTTDESEYIDLVDSSATFYVTFPECSVVGVPPRGGVGWIPSSGSFLCFIIIITFYMGSLLFPFFRFCCQVIHEIILS